MPVLPSMPRRPLIVPLLLFFALGVSALDGVAMTFWVRDHVHLSAAELIEIGIWTQLPWSVKIAFGSLVDSFHLFGNNRRNYMLLGFFLMFLSQLGLLAFVSGFSPVSSEYTNLLVTGLLGTTGLVLAQSVANILAVELVGPEDLGKMQVATRIAVSVGALVAACLTGYLASHYSLGTILTGKLALPLLLALGTLIGLHGSPIGTASVSPQWRMLGLTATFLAYCLLTRNQLAIWGGQMVIVNYLVWRLSGSLAPVAARTFLLSFLAIFLFRVSPDVGPSFSWYLIGPLDFDQNFMGTLRVVSTVIDLLTLLALSKVMARGQIVKSLTWLTVMGTLVAIPPLLVYYGHTGGLSARTVMLADTAVAGPIAEMSMIPLGILIARSAPRENMGMYMAVTASFMNMALVAGDLGSRYLNEVYVVTRTDFSQLGALLLSTTLIGLGLSVLGLLILRYTYRSNNV